jgi:hypothetical protein
LPTGVCSLFFALYTLIFLRIDLLDGWQDPAAADKLLKVQRELDETKVVLVRALSISQNSRSDFPSQYNNEAWVV